MSWFFSKVYSDGIFSDDIYVTALLWRQSEKDRWIGKAPLADFGLPWQPCSLHSSSILDMSSRAQFSLPFQPLPFMSKVLNCRHSDRSSRGNLRSWFPLGLKCLNPYT